MFFVLNIFRFPFSILRSLFLVSGVWCLVSLPAAAQPAEDIKDIRPPVAFPSSRLMWMLMVLGILAAGIIVFLLRRVRFSKKEAPLPPPVPAWEKALAQLAQLKAKQYPQQGRIKEFYVELSLVARHYIEGRFGLNAPEMTTEEFLESLRFSEALNASQKQTLRDFMTSSDMVKFAKYHADPDEMNHGFTLIEDFVRQTVPSSAPAVETKGGSGV
ncbi:MAG TPA: hypothetical protein VLJ10_05670 [Candidatus Bathyarchaeia archaeon]|nr:hypothetical protein [Candidatus Bathyarchaeia archaeon]